MPEHTVQQGECLASIAKQNGFADWRIIYNHARNARFRQLRPNPNIIFPGDTIFIPEKEEKTEDRGTGTEHVFKLNASKTSVRIRMNDEHGKALEGRKYRLVVEGLEKEGTLGADGLIEEEIPADARSGQLTLWLDDDMTRPGFIWNLKLGNLDPVESNSGVQARLKNLGYDCGPVDGIVGPKTGAALKGFQSKFNLPVTGKVDDPTCAKLRELHDES